MSSGAQFRRAALIGAALPFVIAYFSCNADAGGIAIREQSTVGQGMSFAGMGTPSMGLSAMFWNPAAVTQAGGFWSEFHGALFIPRSRITAESGTSPTLLALGESSGNIGEVALIPSSYFAYRINPEWYFGLAISAPFGAATEANTPWAGQQLAITAKLKSFDINPIIGWKVNDQFSIAAGPRFVYAFDGKFTRALLPVSGSPVAELTKLDDIGLGFTAGITYTPSPLTEIALGYRSRVKLTLTGQQDIDLLGIDNARASAPATLPDQVNFGIRQRMTDGFTLLGSVEWTNWSVLDTVHVSSAVDTDLTFNYRDGWFFALGGEYEWTPQTTLRAGIAYEISPVRNQFRDTFLPDDDRWWFSAGLTHRWSERLTLDLGYSFVWLGKSPIDVGPGTGHPDSGDIAPFTLSGTSKTYNHIFAAALRYKWTIDEPGPLITKF